MPTASEFCDLADFCAQARGIELECSALGEAVKRVVPANAANGLMSLIYIARTARNIDLAMGAAVALADALAGSDVDVDVYHSDGRCYVEMQQAGWFNRTRVDTPTRTMALAAAALYAAADLVEKDDDDPQ